MYYYIKSIKQYSDYKTVANQCIAYELCTNAIYFTLIIKC